MAGKLPMPATAMASPTKSQDDYQGEDDHRTLMRAEEVKADPRRMRGVVKHQKKSLRMLTRIGKALPKRAAR